MKIIQIRKRNGKMRTIYAPSRAQKTCLRLMIPELEKIAERVCDPAIVHGFLPGKSPVTNAQQHVGRNFTLCMDLADFFDSVTPEHCKAALGHLTDFHSLFRDDAARQGLPTSPIVANIAAAPMDAGIKALVTPHGVVYTRYADDLSFSCDTLETLLSLQVGIIEIITQHKFQVNPSKTRILAAHQGRRIITGVAVDRDSIHAPRSIRRRLRAATHQRRIRQAAGLAEWNRVRPPRNGRRRVTKVMQTVALHNAQAWFEGIGKPVAF